MKGCIQLDCETFSKNILNFLENAEAEQYNWLITDVECYPNHSQQSILAGEKYCWISGKKLLVYLRKNDFQWVWGVFSAFSKEIPLKEILRYSLPYADGYAGFWKNPISLQNPLATSEIVSWDGELLLFVSKKDRMVDSAFVANKDVFNLEAYNET